ncbi:hypothetical protein 8F11_73 [uncultured Caudovirales phage]|uniref:DUF2313 domain-containing protein n=1 Tax=uncultured Caudovirales phage TaxID=2100421 RepID=A0A2H4J717_9CAUD|nr:hypothetical protein 8F11_73 [uncultured Caudovirales phage]
MTQQVDLRHTELMQMLPRFYDDAPEADGILYADAIEIERTREKARDLLRQLTVTTATWGLSDWERVLELPPSPNSPNELRRARILAKLRGTAPATIANMLAIVNVHTTQNDSQIKELPEPGVVEFIINANNPYDYTELIKDIALYIPAHLAYRVVTLTRKRLSFAVCPQSGIEITVYPYRPTLETQTTKIIHGGITQNAQYVTVYPKGDE